MTNSNFDNDYDSERQLALILTGVFEGCARIYPSALVVTTPNDALKRLLQRRFGGTVEPGGRWILRSTIKRRAIYTDWSRRTLYRRAEIEAALDNLGSR